MADDVDPHPPLSQGPSAFADERFLQPVLAEDGLLTHDYEEDEEESGCDKFT